ncbi:MAG: YgiQ family radical SAM protein [Deltaproteobacteria bacterium]|nr:YgiQ family radical SAM protein [Deltaproteobacteria bacterium]
MEFLPLTKAEVKKRKWDSLDVVIVTGDAYVDHPTFGAALIGRLLESTGLRVAIIAQPDWKDTKDFKRFGRPKLFFGVTSGNVDSMVANYTHNKKKRERDDYSPGGKPGLRPDRAIIVYSMRIKEAFPDVPIVIGGIEASLRRFAHYDFWDNTVRRSILFDSRADILVYGMGERQILAIAERLISGKPLFGIRGTAVVMKRDLFASLKSSDQDLKDAIELPSFEEVRDDKEKFNEAQRIIYRNQNPFKAKTLIQAHGNRLLVVYPPQMPYTTEELDRIYELPFARRWHPAYDSEGGVPAYETVKFSIVSHRGCPGECNFCALFVHQGRIVSSRSSLSILKEAKRIASMEDFKGTITDVGGPTANFYGASCKMWKTAGFCSKRSCLIPKKCENLKIDFSCQINLLNDILNIPRIKHVFIESGLRYDVITDDEGKIYLEALLKRHISGQLKVAPEHRSDKVLRLMNKPFFEVYERFVDTFNRLKKKTKVDVYLVNYFIGSHPGAELTDEIELFLYLFRNRIHPRQIQDFLPTPLTNSTAMYYTGIHPFTYEELYVPWRFRERKLRRALLQYYNEKNREAVVEALKLAKREDLISLYLKSLALA